MAKKSLVAKNDKRRQIVARYAQRRAELKETIRTAADPMIRAEAQRELQRQPRDAGATRVRNRDAADGRPRGYIRAVGLSRVNLRKAAHQGFLPGIRKSSW